MKTKIYFRADGNTQIGLGHLVRCLALAQMLQEEFSIIFVCKEITDDLTLQLQQLGFELMKIVEEVEWLHLLTKNDFVVLDHYELDTTFQIAIKGLGCKLICIDDLHENVFYADLIINHAPGVSPENYNAQSYTQFALGLNYVLLRPIFLKRSEENNKPETLDSLFICFGGSDSKNLTIIIVDLLKQDNRFGTVNIVVGAAYSFLSELKASIQHDQRFKIHHAVDAKEMAGLIYKSNIAIVPASGILQEVLALGCTAISGMYAENQRNIFNNFKKIDAFISAETFSKSAIQNALEEAFSNWEYKKIRLIDGKSGERFLRLFKQLKCENEVIIKRATEHNLNETFKWAKNSSIRKFFFNKKPITFEDHKKWFLRKIIEENCFYYIAFDGDKALGSIRFDIIKDKAEVSYLIDPKFQGNGFGTILLKNGLELFNKDSKLPVKTIIAEVLIENSGSVNVFKKLGYKSTIDHEKEVYKFEKLIHN